MSGADELPAVFGNVASLLVMREIILSLFHETFHTVIVVKMFPGNEVVGKLTLIVGKAEASAAENVPYP